jgi:hypothetical protein
MNEAAPERRAVPVRMLGKTVLLSALILACGCIIGASAASLASHEAELAASAEPFSVDAATSAVTDRLRERLQLSDAQTDAVRRAFQTRLESIAAIRAEVGRRMAGEHGVLDRELRGVLSEDQFAQWQEIREELRANRRRKAGGWLERGG